MVVLRVPTSAISSPPSWRSRIRFQSRTERFGPITLSELTILRALRSMFFGDELVRFPAESMLASNCFWIAVILALRPREKCVCEQVSWL